MKYLKSVLWIIVSFLIMSLLFSLLYYVNILGDKIYDYTKFITPILSLFLGGLYLGKHSTNKGWLEGLKLGGTIILLLFMISYLGFNISLTFKLFIYYLLFLLVTVFGSMFGIRNVEEKDSR